ncbi:dihydroxyacetone kinase family protein [Salinibacterium sp. PAMC 21357]|uniref:dihydroxyacetone kinase family protein n=1 Tax=Salinibacterium sp. PAMC 21357 TaxID=1112215 RepID=UPI00028A0FE6|nr:dihydroxyacetone kinase family protein [Salinibacterium sp. PAMC 21357]
MRKIINEPDAFVDEVMEGIFAAHASQVRPATTDNRTLVRVDSPKTGRVGIVTGGGSGHLPFFLGYVGQGLCSAVAIGNVFSSPSSAQIYAASQAVSSDAGLLYLYGNYGGDVYNFDIAAEMCRTNGIQINTVLGTDDLLSAPPERANDRRGVAGLFLVYKVAGAAADQLLNLDEVTRIANAAVQNTRTMGVGLSPTILPAAGEATFHLADGEMEIGVGIHGEQGTHRGPLESADQITDRFLEGIAGELNLTDGARVAVLVNGLGATPLEELYVMYRRVNSVLAARGVTIAHRFVGEYVTSLEMAGASLSIMILDDELEALIAAPAASPFFQQGTTETISAADAPALVDASVSAFAPAPVTTGTRSVARELLIERLPAMSAHGEELRELDAALGDGDLGITVTKGSVAVAAALRELPEDSDAATLLRAAASAFAAANPSTFAALVGSGLFAAADAMPARSELGLDELVVALQAVFDRVSEKGGARLGDKTFLDVLHPVIQALAGSKGSGAGTIATAAARDAVDASAQLQSARGRAAWQQERTIGHRDPGAVAVLRFVEVLSGE